jgi:hypothetical protein
VVTTDRLPITALPPRAEADVAKRNGRWISPRVAFLLSFILIMMASRDVFDATGARVGTPAVVALVAAVLITGFALLRPNVVTDPGRERRVARALVATILVIGLFLAGGTLARTITDAGSMTWLAVVSGYTMIGLAAAFSGSRRLPHMKWVFAFFLVAHTVMTVALLRSSPAQIDVQVYLHDGVIRLLHGQNPYTMTIPNIYQSPFTEMFYGPDLVVQGRVPVGFPYLPVALLISIPGYVLGDVRYSQLIAMLVTVLLLRRLASDRVGQAAAVLAVAAPTAIPMLTGAWVEPGLVALLACLILALKSHRNALIAVFLGLFLTYKQYVVLAIPIIWLLHRSVSRRVALIGFGIAGLVIMPFFVVDPSAFWRTIFAGQHNLTFRPDSISLLVWSVNEFAWPPPWTYGMLPLLGGGLTAIVLTIRAPRTPAAFAASVGLTLLVTFLLAQAAFMNYYFLASGALLIAAVAWPPLPEPTPLEPAQPRLDAQR